MNMEYQQSLTKIVKKSRNSEKIKKVKTRLWKKKCYWWASKKTKKQKKKTEKLKT